MFDRLIASGNHFADRPLAPSGTVALLAHAVVCVAAVLATLRPPQVFRSAGPPIVLSWPQPSEDGSHGGEVDAVPGPTAPPIDVPPQAPIGIPPIDPRLPFDAKELLRGVNKLADGPWSVTAVDDPPALLAGPPLTYPQALLRAGTVGTVVVQVVIDTLGRAEPGSVVLQSSHAGFEPAARAYVLGAVFRPGRTHGQAVRVLVRLPVDFRLKPVQ
ncbi:MAG TPA: TonB family protein [Gemmatimonadales bacterium]|nr:TonB family protein [Gemmatimonadales bacterium]